MSTWVVGYDEFGNMLWNLKFSNHQEAVEFSPRPDCHHYAFVLLDPNQKGVWGGKEPW